MELEPTDSTDPNLELDQAITGEVAANDNVSPADLIATPAPTGMPFQSDKQALDYVTGGEGPPAPVAVTPKPVAVPASNSLGTFDQGVADQQAAQREIAALEAQERERQAGVLEDKARIHRDNVINARMEDQANEDARAKLVALSDQAAQDVQNFQFHDFFASKPMGKRALLLIGGAIAGVYGDPKAYDDKIKNAIARDYQSQKDQLTSRQNLLEMKRQGIKDFDSHIKTQRDLISLRETAALEAAGLEAEAQGLRSGNPLVQARARELAAKLTQASAEKRLDLQKTIADIERQNALARQAAAKAAASRSGGGSSIQSLSQFIKDHPDDQPGAYALAENLGYRGKKGVDLVDKLQNDFKAGKTAKEEDERNNVRAEEHDPSGLPKGSVIGNVPSGKGGAQGFATRDSEYGRAIGQLEELEHDIKTYGERVFTPEKVKRREALMRNATIGVGTVSPLGKTDSALHEEAGSIGGTGGSWSFIGANGDAVTRKVEELKVQRKRYRDQTLIPLKDAPKPTEAAPERKAESKPALSKAEAFELKKYINSAPKDDPKADQARKVLKANGY